MPYVPMTFGRGPKIGPRRGYVGPWYSGRCRDWIKVKNIAHPAIERAMLIALSKRQGSR
jgi:hypothetical protein